MLPLEELLIDGSFAPVAGVDEAGRGACAGPLTVAACILPEKLGPELDGLDDSKKLSPQTRDRFYEVLTRVCPAWAVVSIDASRIDRRGVQVANIDGMRRAVAQLSIHPEYVLTDAWRIPGLTQPHLAIYKGDATARSIAAASILAKVTRDRYMVHLDTQCPEYGFAGHKGYSTAKHMAAVRRHGASIYHRYTYKNVAAADAEYRLALGGHDKVEEGEPR